MKSSAEKVLVLAGEEHRAEIAAALRLAANKPKHGGAPVMRAVERIYRAEAMKYLASGKTSITCSALLSTSYLSEKGEVYPCTIWDQPLGNVRESNYALMPIIEAARRNGTRQAVVDQKCPNCWTPCGGIYPGHRCLTGSRPARSRPRIIPDATLL